VHACAGRQEVIFIAPFAVGIEAALPSTVSPRRSRRALVPIDRSGIAITASLGRRDEHGVDSSNARGFIHMSAIVTLSRPRITT
jgi:hypothetical protein